MFVCVCVCVCVCPVCVLAESQEIKELLREHGIVVQTVSEVLPIRVMPARNLSHIYVKLGTRHSAHIHLHSHLLYVKLGTRHSAHIHLHSHLGWCKSGTQQTTIPDTNPSTHDRIGLDCLLLWNMCVDLQGTVCCN